MLRVRKESEGVSMPYQRGDCASREKNEISTCVLPKISYTEIDVSHGERIATKPNGGDIS